MLGLYGCCFFVSLRNFYISIYGSLARIPGPLDWNTLSFCHCPSAESESGAHAIHGPLAHSAGLPFRRSVHPAAPWLRLHRQTQGVSFCTSGASKDIRGGEVSGGWCASLWSLLCLACTGGRSSRVAESARPGRLCRSRGYTVHDAPLQNKKAVVFASLHIPLRHTLPC
jgi:hypothetical protein